MTTGEHLIHKAAMATDAGRRRATNEDFVAGPESVPGDVLARKGYLYLVADGVGGYKGGATASRVAVETIQEAYYGSAHEDPETSLREAVRRANRRVRELAQQPEFENMSCTLVAAVVLGERRALIAHVGDSRAYLVRGRSIHRLTEDHSWVAEQVRQGVIAPKAGRNHPYRHIITRSVGAAEEVEPDTIWVDLQPGDRLVLCTDGLTDVVPDGRIGRLAAKEDPQTAVRQLIAEANRYGGPDNISVCVVEVGPASGKSLAAAPERTHRRFLLYAALVASLAALLFLGSMAWLLWPWSGSRPEGAIPAASRPETRMPTPLPTAAVETEPSAPLRTGIPSGSPAPVAEREVIPTPTQTPTPVPPAVPTPASVTVTPTSEKVKYIVQQGNTLSQIACQYHTSIEAIMQANGLQDPDWIYVGQQLIIPLPTPGQERYHVVQPGDTLLAIAGTYGTALEAIVEANCLPNPNYIWVGQRLVIP